VQTYIEKYLVVLQASTIRLVSVGSLAMKPTFNVYIQTMNKIIIFTGELSQFSCFWETFIWLLLTPLILIFYFKI